MSLQMLAQSPAECLNKTLILMTVLFNSIDFRYFTYSFRLLDAHFPRISIIFVLAKGVKEIALAVLGRQ